MIATDLFNPDFASAWAFGVHSECVQRTADFEAALARARGAGPALIELLADPEALTPFASLSEIRATAPNRARD